MSACRDCGQECRNCAGNDFDAKKEQFHKHYQKVLKDIAKRLGLARGEFTVRSNKAGPAIIGDVSLHTDTLYVSVSDYEVDGSSVMYRSCQGKDNHRGHGRNRWMNRETLADADKACAAFREAMAASGKDVGP